MTSGTELTLNKDRLYISKGDEQGKITYCNLALLELAAANESDLIGQPHKIMRHPDMPKGLFHLMWKTLKSKHEFNGFIKNQTANGNYYWAFTNITPVLNRNNQIIGYLSTRRKANPAAIMLFDTYYKQMIEDENNDRSNQRVENSVEQFLALLAAMGDDYETTVFKLQFS